MEEHVFTIQLPSLPGGRGGPPEVRVLNSATQGGVTKLNFGDGEPPKKLDELPEGSKVLKKRFIPSHIGRVLPGGYRKYFHG